MGAKTSSRSSLLLAVYRLRLLTNSYFLPPVLYTPNTLRFQVVRWLVWFCQSVHNSADPSFSVCVCVALLSSFPHCCPSQVSWHGLWELWQIFKIFILVQYGLLFPEPPSQIRALNLILRYSRIQGNSWKILASWILQWQPWWWEWWCWWWCWWWWLGGRRGGLGGKWPQEKEKTLSKAGDFPVKKKNPKSGGRCIPPDQRWAERERD